ncbi:uncharacterized protein LOC129990898 [Argiope bruennichi]|uniref:uncharacterized protein LOC129990898 n=1 Tax=Argiope bruennichi TaxID=94029 RepID=UPI0024956A06|nr:uncharacterized protein LOC129990898 [Argiope bruennichi]
MDDSQTQTFKDSWPLDERETEAIIDFLPVQSQFFRNDQDFDSVLKHDDVVDEIAEVSPKEISAMHETFSRNNDYPQQQVVNIEWNLNYLFNPAPLEIPSKEKCRRWIFAHPAGDINCLDDDKIGKWLLFLDNVHRCESTGKTLHDYAWQFVEELVTNGVLFDAKCSTVMKGVCEVYDKSQKGVICCYTPDYTDKQDVKRAADAIRRAVHYPYGMYYKTDKDTGAGRYAHSGQKHVSTYKHTADRKLYERDSLIKFKWNLVDV